MPSQPSTVIHLDSELIDIAQLLTAGEPIGELTPEHIDRLILEVESADRLLASAKDVHDQVKRGLIALVQKHGTIPANATESWRLQGRHNQATVTIAKTMTVHEDAVDELGTYLATERLDGVFDKLFATSVKHTVIEGSRHVLAGIQLSERRHEKIQSLFGRCISVKAKAPSLRVDVIAPEKPARKPRTKKAVAA